ncbi:hypothetical protein chiPu_0032938, partial [Chiloscyllium punctatum]|nr:hypothetical protein [Chiloscyllium punctatum]
MARFPLNWRRSPGSGLELQRVTTELETEEQEFRMIGALARKFFGSANDRRVKGYQSRVNAINALEPDLVKLTDDELKARTAEFKQQLAQGKTL